MTTRRLAVRSCGDDVADLDDAHVLKPQLGLQGRVFHLWWKPAPFTAGEDVTP